MLQPVMDYKLENAYGFDYETFLIDAQKLAPTSVCFSVANKEQGAYIISDGDDNYQSYVRNLFEAAYVDTEMFLIAQNAKFDAHVFCQEHPDMYDKVCEMYERGQIIDTILVEKLINLTTTGRISSEPPKNFDDDEAKGRKIDYALHDLVKQYFNKDIKQEKEKADSVRTRFMELTGTPSKYYPSDFKQYSIDDSDYVIKIFEKQMDKRATVKLALGVDPLQTLAHRCTLDFHLYRFSMEGVRTNPTQIKKLEKMLSEELSYEKLNLLYPAYEMDPEDWYDFGLAEAYLKRDREKAYLKPSYPIKPAWAWSHKKDCPKELDEWGIPTCDDRCFRREARVHSKDCKVSKRVCKVTRHWLCDCPQKFNQAEENKSIGSGDEKEFVLDENGEKIPIEKDKTNQKRLKTRVINLWFERPHDYDIHFSDGAKTKKGDWKDPELAQWDNWEHGPLTVEEMRDILLKNLDKISIGGEWLDTFAFKDPILDQYAHRQRLVKLETTEIPRMKHRKSGEISEVVHGNFDVLKETGRTSGFASKLYPSANLQNVHKMARTCFKAREGYWILSTDYSSLEFVSAAQRAYDRFGESVYRTIFANGWDAHGYLAAQRAYRSERWFEEECTADGIQSNDYENIYHKFHAYKKADRAIGTYKDKVDDQGEPVKKYFHKHYRNSAKPIGLGILGGMGPKTIAHVSAATYKIEMSIDEAKEYKAIWEEIFKPEAALIQRINREHKDPMFSTRKDSRYRYDTPMGMVRPNCSFAACSNGDILQSPSAEGATLAVIAVAKAAYGYASKSILKDNFKPWAFVHDEILGDVPADPAIATAVAKELERVMCEELKKICPDVKCAADSALQITWNKNAEDFINEDGHLVPWEVSYDEELAKELNYVKKEKVA